MLHGTSNLGGDHSKDLRWEDIRLNITEIRW